jgi:hypothetical protein
MDDTTVGPEDVRRAAEVSVAALEPLAGADWEQLAGDLEWTAAATLEHIIEGLVFYARDLATPVIEPAAEELRLVCAPDTSPAAPLDGLQLAAAVVAAGVAAAPDEVRAFHPSGAADASGFAAMACDEILIHSDDIARGLGTPFEPPRDVCERVLGRLFPWAPRTRDAWQRLRWANGRAPLDDLPRLPPDWEWHCAPLDEWDGSVPTSRTQARPDA